jgi:hypothetical protein
MTRFEATWFGSAAAGVENPADEEMNPEREDVWLELMARRPCYRTCRDVR